MIILNILNHRQYKRVALLASDLGIICLLYLLSSLLIQEFRLPGAYGNGFYSYVLVISLIYVSVFYFFRLYRCIWIVAGYHDYLSIVRANIVAASLTIFYFLLFLEGKLPLPLVIISSEGILLGTLANRMFLRIYKRLIHKNSKSTNGELPCGGRNILIVGAGDAAALIINEIRNHPELQMNIIGLVDDADYKQNGRINGCKVLGKVKDIPEIVKECVVDEILLAIPSASHEERRVMLNIAKNTPAKLKTLPGLYEMVDKGVNISSIRDVEIADLLGRKEIHLNNEKISEYIEGKTVLVTGGGGSIGSELCRQIAKLHPKLLIILDIYENNAYDIENELKRDHPNLNLLVLITTVTDKKKIDWIFRIYRPETVFHAAAHKHVPLMENNPDEAIKNNVFGTLNVSSSAHNFGAEKFILISTDKAVNPTNIMGASKRICEMIVQSMDDLSEKTRYVAVRFGNVLGSNGSVIPLFKEQIRNGGPITLTHRDIVRYFMTIPEAVQLVMQAGTYAKGGEIFVLDMGDPVKIYDLAENLIRLSGYEPHKEIEIKITGLRAGEKLYEELLMAEEGLKSTPNKLIFVGRIEGIDKKKLNKMLEDLEKDVYDDGVSGDRLKEIISEIVPTYVPDLPKEERVSAL